MIQAIATRAVGIMKKHDLNPAMVESSLAICHGDICPLDLNRLAAADDFNLVHDVAGIVGHLDVVDGRLRDFFMPRHAACYSR